MKRAIIAAVLAAALSAGVSAQEPGSSCIGVKGGLNYTKVRGDEVEGVNYLTGYAFGAFYRYQVAERFAVSPEVLYSVKGAKEKDTDNKYELSYVEIPLLLRLIFPTSSVATPAVYAGPYIGFLMSAEYEGIDVKDTTAGTDYGVVFGAGADIELGGGGKTINIDVRYSLGLADLNDDPEITGEVLNTGFQFLAGFGFSL
jgi:opacity protein-like surface antigen